MQTKTQAMRDALEFCKEVIREYGTGAGDFFRAIQIAESALEMPMLNCEVGTAEDQAKRFKAFCRNRQCGSCYGCPIPKKGFCTLQWAQMPYAEEGGAK